MPTVAFRRSRDPILKRARGGNQGLESHLFGPGRREALAQALEATDPEKEEWQDEAERLRGEVADLALKIRRQMANLEAMEADTEAAARSGGASGNWRRSGGVGSGSLSLPSNVWQGGPIPTRPRNWSTSSPCWMWMLRLLAERSFRELLAALDFAASFHPDEKELRVSEPCRLRGTHSI